VWGQAYAGWVVANVYADRGEPAHALEVMETAIQLSEQAGFTGGAIGIRNQMAIVCAQYGLHGRALEIAARAIALAGPNFVAWLPWANAVNAYALARVGKTAEAEHAAQRARRTAIPFSLDSAMALFASRLLLAEAEIALAQNDRAYEPAALDGLIDYVLRNQADALLPEALLTQARVFLAREKLDAAREVLTRARQAAERLTQRRMLWEIYATLAQIESRCGNADAAQRFRAQAREVVDYIAGHATQDQRAAFLNWPDARAVMAGS